jgi:outer membrane protein
LRHLARRLAVLFCVSLPGGVVSPPVVRAADAPGIAPPPVQDKDGWIVTVRLTGAVAPSFPGSGQLRPYPFPSVSFRRIGEPEIFSTPDEGFGFAVLDFGNFRAGPVANFVFKRGQRDGLFGLHRVGLTHEVGGFAEFTTDRFRARAELRQGVDGHKGFVAVLSADLYASRGPVSISIGPRFDIGDNRYANAYFSVSPLEALVNGRLTPYEATGGFTAAGGLATLRYDFTPDTNATIFGGVQRLMGSVGQSPIPNLLGSRDQFTAGLSVGRSFEIKNLW